MSLLQNKYFVRKKETDEWEDITTKFVGVKILSLTGLDELGETVNVYLEQFVNSQAEDFMVTTEDGEGNNVVIRKNVDLSVTFVCGERYGATDTQRAHTLFTDYFANDGDFYIKSAYDNMEAHVVCLKGYKPTAKKLHRGTMSYIMGTIELHTLNIPSHNVEPSHDYELFIGFGGSSLNSLSEIENLSNVQHFSTDSIAGNYSIVCGSQGYLWICTNGVLAGVTANGFEVPMQDTPISIGDYRCYRSGNAIVPHTMAFTITT